MPNDTTTIVLAGQEFVLPRFKLKQIRDLTEVMMRNSPDPKADMQAAALAGLDRSVDLLVVALRQSTPPVTADKLLEMDITPKELTASVMRVLKWSGVVPEEGEAPAGAS